MNDADYVYGVHAMDKDVWELIAKLYERAGHVCKFSNECDTERTWGEFKSGLTVKDITDEEYNALKNMGLIGFGEDLPIIYLEDEDLELEFDPNTYRPRYYNYDTKSYKYYGSEE